jgi:hypothetical protein
VLFVFDAPVFANGVGGLRGKEVGEVVAPAQADSWRSRQRPKPGSRRGSHLRQMVPSRVRGTAPESKRKN